MVYHTNIPVNEKCGGIIIDVNQRRLLVVLNRQSHLKGENKWGLPKGHKMIGEGDVACAKREVFEETGISLHSKRFHRKVSIHSNTYFVIILRQKFEILNSLDSKEICKVVWKTPAELRMETLNRDLNILLNYINRMPLVRLCPQGVMNTLVLPKNYRSNRHRYNTGGYYRHCSLPINRNIERL